MSYEKVLDTTISNLVETQFPEFYREEGPIFVEFVKQFYTWLETQQLVANVEFLNSISSRVNVTAKSANVSLTKYNTRGCLCSNFANDDYIALWNNNYPNTYTIHKIQQVVEAEKPEDRKIILYANNLPDFTSSNTRYSTVSANNNAVYHARRMLEYNDIDTTADDFLVYFRNKHLKHLPLETIGNFRTLVKHSTDIYRSKGTERSIDLAFKLAYGAETQFYYPSKDLFRTSDAVFYRPRYLEVALSELNINFLYKQIYGLKTGATAFVDSIIRKNVKGKLVDVLFISSIENDFEIGEKINSTDRVLAEDDCPSIVGSLTEIELDVTGLGTTFEVGNIIDVYSATGEGAKARVANTVDNFGVVTFTLDNGGFGYTANSEILVSEKLMFLNVHTFTVNTYITEYETLTQPLANLQYSSANGTFTAGEEIYTYHANNDLKGTGRVLSFTATNSTAGELKASVLSGNLSATNIYNTANAIGANIVYTDVTATANIIGMSANVILTVINATGNFINSEIITVGSNASATVVKYNNVVGSNGQLHIILTSGTLNLNDTITGSNSAVTANISALEIQVGVQSVNGTFVNTPNNYYYTNTSNNTGTIRNFTTTGSGADFAISSSLLHTETIDLNDDLLADYVAVELDAATYGFPGNTSGNLTFATIEDCLSYASYDIGKIRLITSQNSGSEYPLAPMVKILEPKTFMYNKRGLYYFELSDTSGNFEIGEVIVQGTTNAYGLVVESNSTYMVAEKLNLLNEIVVTSNSTTQITGELSAVTANVTSIDFESTNIIGYNAVIDSDVSQSNSSVVAVEIIDSGFGFVNNQVVYLQSNNETITGRANLLKQGVGQGYFKTEAGFLSSDSRLFDGFYYQHYSYEIRSEIRLEKYEKMLKKLLHVAGTKYFAALLHTAVVNSNILIESSVVQE